MELCVCEEDERYEWKGDLMGVGKEKSSVVVVGVWYISLVYIIKWLKNVVHGAPYT